MIGQPINLLTLKISIGSYRDSSGYTEVRVETRTEQNYFDFSFTLCANDFTSRFETLMEYATKEIIRLAKEKQLTLTLTSTNLIPYDSR